VTAWCYRARGRAISDGINSQAGISSACATRNTVPNVNRSSLSAVTVSSLPTVVMFNPLAAATSSRLSPRACRIARSVQTARVTRGPTRAPRAAPRTREPRGSAAPPWTWNTSAQPARPTARPTDRQVLDSSCASAATRPTAAPMPQSQVVRPTRWRSARGRAARPLGCAAVPRTHAGHRGAAYQAGHLRPVVPRGQWSRARVSAVIRGLSR